MSTDQPSQAKASATKRKADDIDGDALSPVSAVEVPMNLSSAVQPLYCSVCREVFVSTVTLVPCGHGMCFACSKEAAECPECRGPIVSAARCWSIDSVISSLMDVQSKSMEVSFFPPDDVQCYHDRLTNIKNVAPHLSRSVESEVAAPVSTPQSDTDQETARLADLLVEASDW
jgi:Zinc finger, C3HC4 type (RING finger)